MVGRGEGVREIGEEKVRLAERLAKNTCATAGQQPPVAGEGAGEDVQQGG